MLNWLWYVTIYLYTVWLWIPSQWIAALIIWSAHRELHAQQIQIKFYFIRNAIDRGCIIHPTDDSQPTLASHVIGCRQRGQAKAPYLCDHLSAHSFRQLAQHACWHGDNSMLGAEWQIELAIKFIFLAHRPPQALGPAARIRGKKSKIVSKIPNILWTCCVQTFTEGSCATRWRNQSSPLTPASSAAKMLAPCTTCCMHWWASRAGTGNDAWTCKRIDGARGVWARWARDLGAVSSGLSRPKSAPVLLWLVGPSEGALFPPASAAFSAELENFSGPLIALLASPWLFLFHGLD